MKRSVVEADSDGDDGAVVRVAGDVPSGVVSWSGAAKHATGDAVVVELLERIDGQMAIEKSHEATTYELLPLYVGRVGATLMTCAGRASICRVLGIGLYAPLAETRQDRKARELRERGVSQLGNTIVYVGDRVRVKAKRAGKGGVRAHPAGEGRVVESCAQGRYVIQLDGATPGTFTVLSGSMTLLERRVASSSDPGPAPTATPGASSSAGPATVQDEDDQFMVSTEDLAVHGAVMRVAKKIFFNSEGDESRCKQCGAAGAVEGLGERPATGTHCWVCVGHREAAREDVLRELASPDDFRLIVARFTTDERRELLLKRAAQGLFAASPKRSLSAVLAGSLTLTAPILLAGTGLVAVPISRASATATAETPGVAEDAAPADVSVADAPAPVGDVGSVPFSQGIEPHCWWASGLPALPPPPPGYEWGPGAAYAFRPPPFLTTPPPEEERFIPYDAAALRLAPTATSQMTAETATDDAPPPPPPPPPPETAVMWVPPWGPVEGEFWSPWGDDGCEDGLQSVGGGASCIVPARTSRCAARFTANGIWANWAPLYYVPGGIFDQLLRDGRVYTLGSLDGSREVAIVARLTFSRIGDLHVDSSTLAFPELATVDARPLSSLTHGAAIVFCCAASLGAADRVLFGGRGYYLRPAMGGACYGRKRYDANCNGVTVLFVKRDDAVGAAEAKSGLERCPDPRDCRDPRDRSKCGDKLRKAILAALPYASAVGGSLRRSQLLEDEVLVEDLQSLGGLGGS